MKYVLRLLFAFVTFFSGAALVPLVGLPNQGYRWQPYADAYTPLLLEINHTSGMPGSFFTVTGFNFLPDDMVEIHVNGVLLGSVQADSSGGFVAIIDTTGADPGYYAVTTDKPESPSVMFHLSLDDPLQPQEGEGSLFSLPSGIAFRHVNLPIIMR